MNGNEFDFRKNNFDLIRLIAAMQVVLLHGIHHFNLSVNNFLLSIMSIFPGVPIFFVTSGYLISASLERSSSLNSYLQNRFLRIYPALWVCFLISIASVFVFYTPEVSLKEIIPWILAQISIGQFYNPEFLRGYGVGVLNGSLWTIPVELQFYLLLPLLYIIFNRTQWNKIFITTLMLILIIVNQYSIYISGNESLLVKLFRVTIPPYLYMFLIGVLLQRNIGFVKKYLVSNVFYILPIYLLVSLVTSNLDLNSGGNNINPVSAVTLALLTISFAYTNPKMSSFIKGYDISYGVYIYHMIFVNILLTVSLFSAEANFVLMIVMTVIAAMLSWVIIEKPALSLKKYTIKRSKVL